ncbi:MAG TPA: acyltransferase [Jiangellaceae bacterium]
MKVRDAAQATPTDRDRVIDFARAASLVVVILGHWLMASVTISQTGIRGSNALAELPSLTLLTWLLQVMPLFFVAGGFANLASWRSVRHRGGGYANYAYGRVLRLVSPTLVFVTAVPLLLLGVSSVEAAADHVALLGRLLGQPLWFLGMYVPVMALAPVFARWHRRRPVAVLLGLGLMAAATDAVRFAGYESVGYLNFGFVWLFAHQLGFWYADRHRLPRRAWWAILAGSIVLLAGLTGLGPYPVSMVGLPGEMSNMAPPTVCLLVLAGGQLAALVLARSWLAGWLRQPGPWLAVVLVGSRAMTLYLWHLLVLVVGFAVLIWLNAPLPAPGSATWWLSRPVWCVLLAGVLAVMTSRLVRFERIGGPPDGDHSPAVAGAGMVMVSAGLFVVVMNGLAPSLFLVVGVAAMAGGLTLTALAAGVRRHIH